MTPYDDILDLALISIEDYRLNKLSVESPAKFKLVLEGFMIRGLSNFENCVKNLSDRDDDERHEEYRIYTNNSFRKINYCRWDSNYVVRKGNK